uniref:Conotoxin superfamily P n=1 Tax=Conus ermineus TaxID=55423 RepID=A0A346CJ29_CONER|nr:conotoxin precursor superfamily P [Conus ermineus]
MHPSLAGSAVLMLLLLFALGNFVGVQSGQIARDADNGQLKDDRRNLQSQRKPMTLFKSLYKRSSCTEPCIKDTDCTTDCTICLKNLSKCM